MNTNNETVFDNTDLVQVVAKLKEICKEFALVEVSEAVDILNSIDTENVDNTVISEKMAAAHKILADLAHPTRGRVLLVENFKAIIDIYEESLAVPSEDEGGPMNRMVNSASANMTFSAKVGNTNLENEETSKTSKEGAETGKTEESENSSTGDQAKDTQKIEEVNETNAETGSLDNNSLTGESIGTKVKVTKTLLKQIPTELVEKYTIEVNDFVFVGDNNIYKGLQKAGSEDIVLFESEPTA